MKTIFQFLRRPIAIFLIIFITAGIYGYFYFFKKSAAPPETTEAKKGSIIQEVSVTGKVKSAQSVDLAFEKSGKVAEVGIKVGDKVIASRILARLENADLIAQLNEAEAKVKAQEAKLNELKAGTRPEEIKVQEVKVENAKITLEDNKINLVDKIKDAYTKSDDGVRNKTDQLFSNPRGSNPQINIPGFYEKTEIEWQRVLIESTLVNWQNSLTGLNPSLDLEKYLKEAKLNLEKVKDFLDFISLGVNSLVASADLSQTTIDTYKSDISTGRTNLNTAIVNLSSAEKDFRSGQSSLTLAESELFLKKAGTIAEQISAQIAQVEQAQANVKNIQAQIAKTILRSPISGVVTKQDAKVGEVISASTVLISIISDAKFEIEANIPEADIAKVKIGDLAKLTLDAYASDDIFEARVVKIDPAETIIEAVATYKTTLQFAKEDSRVKSGMTANIDILTAKKENAIIIPQRLVIIRNGEKFLRILNSDGTVSEVSVQTGLRGSDGNIEIISGINKGDKVIVSAK